MKRHLFQSNLILLFILAQSCPSQAMLYPETERNTPKIEKPAFSFKTRQELQNAYQNFVKGYDLLSIKKNSAEAKNLLKVIQNQHNEKVDLSFYFKTKWLNSGIFEYLDLEKVIFIKPLKSKKNNNKEKQSSNLDQSGTKLSQLGQLEIFFKFKTKEINFETNAFRIKIENSTQKFSLTLNLELNIAALQTHLIVTKPPQLSVNGHLADGRDLKISMLPQTNRLLQMQSRLGQFLNFIKIGSTEPEDSIINSVQNIAFMECLLGYQIEDDENTPYQGNKKETKSDWSPSCFLLGKTSSFQFSNPSLLVSLILN